VLVIFDHILALRSYTETNRLNEIGSKKSIVALFELKQDQVKVSESLSFIHIPLSRFTKFVLSLNSRLYWLCKTSTSISLRRRIWKSNNFHLPKIVEKLVLRPLIFPICTILVFLIFFTERNLYRQILEFANQGGKRILYVSVGGTSSMNDFFCLVARKLKIELVVVLENWDNMSSKAVFNFIPSRIGVWGKQAQMFALRIHGIPSEQTQLVGNPRVEWLKQNINVERAHKHILFAGGSSDFEDEIEYLSTLARLASFPPTSWEIRYLPHPKRYLAAKEQLPILDDMGITVLNRDDNEYIQSKFQPSITKH
jgi:hypothetical protein